MFAHEFVRNAWLAGTFIALACGTIGWFVVLRGQVFAGDALSHVAFVGAIAAATVGIDERIGLFALTLALAAGLGLLGRRAQADDVTIGTAFAWILGHRGAPAGDPRHQRRRRERHHHRQHAVRVDLLPERRGLGDRGGRSRWRRPGSCSPSPGRCC